MAILRAAGRWDAKGSRDGVRLVWAGLVGLES